MRMAMAGLAGLLATAVGCGKAPPPAQPAATAAPEPAATPAPDPMALVVVIDRSGSMSGTKIERAKQGVFGAAGALPPGSSLSVIVFDSQPTVVLPLATLDPGPLEAALDRVTAGGGTNIFPALQDARDQLGAAVRPNRHVLLLTDGQASYDGIAELVDSMRASGITVSAIGIGDYDPNLLQLITEHGGGRLYRVSALDELPDVFVRETRIAARGGAR